MTHDELNETEERALNHELIHVHEHDLVLYEGDENLAENLLEIVEIMKSPHSKNDFTVGLMKSNDGPSAYYIKFERGRRGLSSEKFLDSGYGVTDIKTGTHDGADDAQIGDVKKIQMKKIGGEL